MVNEHFAHSGILYAYGTAALKLRAEVDSIWAKKMRFVKTQYNSYLLSSKWAIELGNETPVLIVIEMENISI